MEQAPSICDAAGHLPRSPELMNRSDTALLVVDVQEKLVKLLRDEAAIVWNVGRLIDAAKVLGMPVAATEQNPAKLGPMAAPLAERLEAPAAKMAFSCGECGEFFSRWHEAGIDRVLVCGIETHVCVQQTALDVTAAGFQVYVAVNAVGARHAIDHETALRRMEMAGVVLTTAEAAMFEWCRLAGTPEFREISALAKEAPPG